MILLIKYKFQKNTFDDCIINTQNKKELIQK